MKGHVTELKIIIKKKNQLSESHLYIKVRLGTKSAQMCIDCNESAALMAASILDCSMVEMNAMYGERNLRRGGEKAQR